MLSKAAEQWQFAEGTAADGFSAKQQKAFCSILQCTDQRNVLAMINCQTPEEL